MTGMLKTAAIAAFAAVLGFGASASRAATMVQSGSTYDGWQITVPAGVALTVDSSTSTTLTLEKFAYFVNDEGLPIVFTQESDNAAPLIDIANEMITNHTSTTWSGFQFLLVNVASTLGAGTATFEGGAGNVFAPPVGYSTVSAGSNEIDYSGTQTSVSTSSWGFGTDGDLIINAAPSSDGTMGQDFVFKEVPLTGGPLVPLPAAAWQGLTGLMTLGLIAGAKKLKNRMA